MSGWSEQAALTARNRALAETGGGKEKGLALVNEVGIAEIGVGGGDAGPGCAMAELRLRDGPQQFAAADLVLH